MTQNDNVVVLDVRDMLRRKEEPFEVIMKAIETLPAGYQLQLHATFEPVPLFRVLSKQGFEHQAVSHADDHWEITFWRAEKA